jgi:hypothetical protein
MARALLLIDFLLVGLSICCFMIKLAGLVQNQRFICCCLFGLYNFFLDLILSLDKQSFKLKVIL